MIDQEGTQKRMEDLCETVIGEDEEKARGALEEFLGGNPDKILLLHAAKYCRFESVSIPLMDMISRRKDITFLDVRSLCIHARSSDVSAKALTMFLVWD